MKSRRLASLTAMSIALVVGLPLAAAEPADGDSPATTTTAPVTTTNPSSPDPTAPADPSPSVSGPSDPVPTDPAPTDPTPSDPAPTDPEPTDPEPTESEPAEPSPSESEPSSSPTTSEEPTETPSPTPSPTYQEPSSPWKGGSGAAKAASEPPPLSEADLAAQIAQADALLAELTAGNTELAALLKELDELTDKANAALETKAAADEALRTTTRRAESSRATADALAKQLAQKHQQLRDWAFSAYSDGGLTAEMVQVFDAMIKDPAKAGNPVGDLAYLTDERVRLFQDIRHLTARQEKVATRAEADVVAAEDAAAKAAEATVEAEKAVKAHEDAVAKAQGEQADILQNAGPLAAMLLGVSSPEAKKRGQAILDALVERNLDLPDLDKPCSDDNNTYPNGQLPASALCPLWMAPGEYAIPRAAAAFNALSKKFTEDFGRPICVTDSYRSFSQQVAVKASRGFWAATPGYSNHGFGRALDLCGGINSFGTIEHRWMRQNAPAYGWFHPSWAGPGGRKPEPWHWEFAG